MTLADAFALLESGTLWSSTGRCKGYAVANHGEAAKIDAYVAELAAGHFDAAPPVLSTPTGRGLVGLIAAAVALGAAATPTPEPIPGQVYLFADEFDGPAGAPPNPAKWVNLDGINYGPVSRAKAANAFLDGNGNLVLRVTREPWYGKTFAGALIGTYQYQTGWPPSPIRAAWPVPFRYESRFLIAPTPGAWNVGGWNQNVDKTDAQGIAELDCAEIRGTYPTVFGMNQHLWVNRADAKAENASKASTDGRTNWHTAAVEATAAETRYYLDGVLAATHSGVTGRFGVLLHNVIADLSSWGSGGQQPAADDPGPWDMRIDYVRVAALT